MNSTTHWIWKSTESRKDWNQWVEFRATFVLSQLSRNIKMRVSADSSYVAWINGQWVGSGPPRSFPHKWAYDEWNIRTNVKEGANDVRILVHASGIATFRNLPSNAGLIAEVEADGEVILATGEKWECREDPVHINHRKRISCQQSWQEILDTSVQIDPSWFQAQIVDDDRYLYYDPIQTQVVTILEPATTLWTKQVLPPQTIFSLPLREYLLPNYEDAAPQKICGLVSFMFHVKHSQTLQFEFPGDWFWVRPKGYLNGTPLIETPSSHNPWSNGVALEGQTCEGDNFVVLDVSGHFHEWHLKFTISDIKLSVQKVRIAGPFEPENIPQELFSDPLAWENHPLVQTPSPYDLTNLEKDAFLRTAFSKTPTLDNQNTLGHFEPELQICLDFGKMTVGYWEYEIEADQPGTLWVNGFEALQEAIPDFCWEMSNTIEHHFGRGLTHYRSPIRRGGRYLLFQGKNFQLRKVRIHESTYPSKLLKKFECSDPLLNTIHEMSCLSVRLCSEDTFVDCPTYEQTFWVGDARNQALINYYTFGDWPLVRRCWELAAESLSRSPLVESHVPSGWQNIIPAWSFLWAIGCWEHYWYTGNIQFLKAILPALEKQLDNTANFINEQGLFSIQAWNLCDWAPMDTPGEGVVTHNQGWLVWAAKTTALAAETCKHQTLVAKADEIIQTVTEATNTHLWVESLNAYADCLDSKASLLSQTVSLQTQTVLSLAGIPTSERQSLLDQLAEGSRNKHNFVPIGSPFFMFFWFEWLERLGRFDLILRTIREQWGMMVERGATTCWELFPGFMHNGRWTRSHCHGWGAAPAYFLSRNLLGIVPKGTNWSTVDFNPHRLDVHYCSGSIPTPQGPIKVEWNDLQGKLNHHIQAPPEVKIRISEV